MRSRRARKRQARKFASARPGFAGSPARSRPVVGAARDHLPDVNDGPAFTRAGLRWTRQQAMAYGGASFIVRTVVCLSCHEAARPRGCVGGAGP
jgi:hypothetical protein